MHTPSKVRDLDLSMDSHEDILRLDISVHNMLLVEIPQGCCHLCDVLCCFPFGKSVLFPQMFIQLALASKFKDEEDSFAIVEMTVEAENIRMAQIAVDLDFPSDLLLDLSLLQLAFVEDLQRADKTSRSLLGQVDPPKFSLSQWLSNLKHPKVEFLWLWLLINWRIGQSLYGAFV